jgi:3-oxoacyl-[acyl-carrier protein] reductase
MSSSAGSDKRLGEGTLDLGLNGKVALVCASSHGLGFATAHRLAREGASVVVCGRDAMAVDAARQRIEADGGKVLGIPVNLSDAAERVRLVKEIEAGLGPIDICVLNTGGPPVGTFETLTLDQWRDAYDLLVQSVVHLAQLVLPGMAERKWGRVLAVTSFVAREPANLMVLSNSLRASVNGLMRTLANEYGPHGVTVNSILPGYILTDRMQKVVRAQAEARGLPPDQALDPIANNAALRRVGQPDEFGNLAAFLVSEAASYVTGTAITIDGGLSRGVY